MEEGHGSERVPWLEPLKEEHKNEDGSVKEEYFDEVYPPGYRFDPTDEELVEYYLMKSVNDQELPPHKIREAYVYHHSPQEITAQYKVYRENEWFFFTKRERKYKKGGRPDRGAGVGFWKPTGTTVKFLVNGVIAAEKTSLDYYAGSHHESQRTEWKMHEYVLPGSNIPLNTKGNSNSQNDDMTLNDRVLCKIYKSNRKKNQRNDHADQIEPRQAPDEELNLPVSYSQHTDNGIARLDAQNSLPAWEMSLAAGSSSIFSDSTATGIYNNGSSPFEPLMSYGSSGSLEEAVNQSLHAPNSLPAWEMSQMSLAAGSSSIFSDSTVAGMYNNGSSPCEPLMSYRSSGSLEEAINQSLDAPNSLPAWEMSQMSLAAGSSSIFSDSTVAGMYNNGSSPCEPLISYGSSGSLEEAINQFLVNSLPVGEDVLFSSDKSVQEQIKRVRKS